MIAPCDAVRANLSPFGHRPGSHAQNNDDAVYEALRRLKFDIYSNDGDHTNKTTLETNDWLKKL